MQNHSLHFYYLQIEQAESGVLNLVIDNVVSLQVQNGEESIFDKDIAQADSSPVNVGDNPIETNIEKVLPDDDNVGHNSDGGKKQILLISFSLLKISKP